MNTSFLKLTNTIFLCLFMASCTGPIFYWGDYSHTLYRMKKNADEKSRGEHKKELLEIIEKTKKKKYTIPPGVYCEYGYLMYQEDNLEEALKYYELEKETYPESKTFVERLIAMIAGEKPSENSNISNSEINESQPVPIENQSGNQ